MPLCQRQAAAMVLTTLAAYVCEDLCPQLGGSKNPWGRDEDVPRSLCSSPPSRSGTIATSRSASSRPALKRLRSALGSSL